MVRYAKKIQKNPELSPMYDLDKNSEFKNANLDEFGTLDTRKILCIIALIIALVAIVYGCINLEWDFAEQSAISWSCLSLSAFWAALTPTRFALSS